MSVEAALATIRAAAPLAGRDGRAREQVSEGRPTTADRLKDDEIALVLNTTEGTQAVSDSRDIRTVALTDRIPYFTTAAGAVAAAAAIRSREEGDVRVRTLQG